MTEPIEGDPEESFVVEPKAPRAKVSALLVALFAAQGEALSIPATTTKVTRDGAKTVEATYAGSEDVLRTARVLLHKHGLMATPVSTAIRDAKVMTLVVELLHVPTGGRLQRSFEVEVGDWGSNAAAVSAFATVLRLLLMLPREPEQVAVRLPELPPEPEDGPRATERIVIPSPLLPRVQARADRQGQGQDLEGACMRLALELAKHREPDHRAWKSAARVPISGPLTPDDQRKYSAWLAGELRALDPPADSGSGWAHVDGEAPPD